VFYPLRLRDQISQPHKATGKIKSLYILMLTLHSLFNANTEVGQEVNIRKTKYMFMSHLQNAGKII